MTTINFQMKCHIGFAPDATRLVWDVHHKEDGYESRSVWNPDAHAFASYHVIHSEDWDSFVEGCKNAGVELIHIQQFKVPF